MASTDSAALPTAGRFGEFLAALGWHHADNDDCTSLWTKQAAGQRLQVVLPMVEGTADSQILLREALDTVAYSLGQSADEVLQDLHGPVEQVLVRLHPSGPAGQAPVTLLESTVRGLRDVVVGAASALFTESMVLPARRPTLAEEFAGRARVATGAGSFVVTMLLPLNTEADVPLDGFESEPLGRQVTDLLAEFAAQARGITDLESVDPGAWEESIVGPVRMPNATVLAGLAAIGGPDRLPYTLRIVQSAAVTPYQKPVSLDFSTEAQEAIGGLARYLRSRSPARGTQLRGLVIRLSRDGVAGPGEAVIEGVHDDSQSVGRVTVILSEPDYHQAILAHKLGRHVTMTGDLSVRGNRKYFENVTGFDVLPEEGLRP